MSCLAVIPEGKTAFLLDKLLIPVGSVVKTAEGLDYRNSVRIKLTWSPRHKSWCIVLPNQCPGEIHIELRSPRWFERVSLFFSKEMEI